MKLKILSILILIFSCAAAQNRPSTFFGNVSSDFSVCPGKSANAFTEQQVEDMITAMLDKIGIRNSFIIMDCPQVENCQATVWTDGKPYILYNPQFLSRVKRLNFASANLPGIGSGDWETLTLLAHELGHLVNNHFTNPKPGTTARDWELEADAFAGFMIYMLGGTVASAQSIYNSQLISESGSYTHPGRTDRIKAVEKGWNNARLKYPRQGADINSPDPSAENYNYKTVRIGGQVWMAENLRTTRYANGDPIPQVKNISEWSNLTTGAWCYYNNDPEMGNQYGILYNWYAINDKRGLAPPGYRVATTFDWNTLFNELDPDQVNTGNKLKAEDAWTDNRGAATNSSGFTALPGGVRFSWLSFKDRGSRTAWWCVMSGSKDSVAYITIRSTLTGAYLEVEDDEKSKTDGFYIRCIKKQ